MLARFALVAMLLALTAGCNADLSLGGILRGAVGTDGKPGPAGAAAGPAGAPPVAGSPGPAPRSSEIGTIFPVDLVPDPEGGPARSPVPIAALLLTGVAGTGAAGFAGDGGPAEAARFSAPAGIAWGRSGLVVADTGNHRVRRFEFDGTVTTAGGTGRAGNDGDGADAADLALSSPSRVASDAEGNMFFSDTGNGLVRCIAPQGRLLTVAGGGAASPDGSSRVATDVTIREPLGLAFAPDGTLYIADAGTGRVLVYSRDGHVRALPATFERPTDVAVSLAGDLAVADAGARRVWRVSAAGEKSPVVGPDHLASAAGLAFGEAGDLLVADPAASRIWLVGLDGTVSAAVESEASAIGTGPRGQFFLADPAGHRVSALVPR